MSSQNVSEFRLRQRVHTEVERITLTDFQKYRHPILPFSQTISTFVGDLLISRDQGNWSFELYCIDEEEDEKNVSTICSMHLEDRDGTILASGHDDRDEDGNPHLFLYVEFPVKEEKPVLVVRRHTNRFIKWKKRKLSHSPESSSDAR